MKILFSGKGGTGKTTLSCLFSLFVKKEHGPLLLIDADPNSSIQELLGIEVDKKISDIVDEIQNGSIPSGMSKPDYIKMKINEIIYEDEGMDILVMGFPEREGCYCFINSILRSIIKSLESQYPLCIVDNEAGLEHFSRRTSRGADWVFIVTEPNILGINTAYNILRIINNLKLHINRKAILVNKSQGENFDYLKKDFDEVFYFPLYDKIYKLSQDRKVITSLIDDEPVSRSLEAIEKKIWSITEKTTLRES